MVSSNFYSKEYININLKSKTMIFKNFLWFSPEHSSKARLSWQQGRIYAYHFYFKILPMHVGEKFQSFKRKSLSDTEIFVKTTEEGTPPGIIGLRKLR